MDLSPSLESQTRLHGFRHSPIRVIRLAKRRARGFRNFLYLRTIAYWNTGKLNINSPPLAPT